MNEKYQVLFETFKFPCGLESKNRLVLAPMTHWSSNPDGTVSEEELPYYQVHTQDIGVAISAAVMVALDGKGFSGQFGVHNDDMIEGLTKLANTLKNNGSLAVLQLHHGGRMSPPDAVPNGKIYSASAIPAQREGAPVPLEMTEEHIFQTIQAFGDATRRAIQAGFDGVEIHGANTYLLQQFFSPHSNRRTDRWGGDVHQRMAFPLAIIDQVKQTVATHSKKPFLIGYRFSPEEMETPGITFEDSLLFAETLAKQGLDYLHVSTNNFWGGSMRDPSDQTSRPWRIFEKVGHKIPVIGVGSIRTPDDALKVLETGIPLIALGRELIAEPHWVKKVKSNQIDSIRTTISKKDQAELIIPNNLWNMMNNVPYWFPMVD
jgi:2,4-dienoyl-CoA reductase-like NADH-dependent reductase (Old Yellow Enzyme family)